MKRDWDLIRLLLLHIESDSIDQIQEYNSVWNYLRQSTLSAKIPQIVYHLHLLCNAEFIEGVLEGDPKARFKLTERGIGLLEVLRDEQKYRKAMKVIEEHDCGATEEILVALINRLP